MRRIRGYARNARVTAERRRCRVGPRGARGGRFLIFRRLRSSRETIEFSRGFPKLISRDMSNAVSHYCRLRFTGAACIVSEDNNLSGKGRLFLGTIGTLGPRCEMVRRETSARRFVIRGFNCACITRTDETPRPYSSNGVGD